MLRHQERSAVAVDPWGLWNAAFCVRRYGIHAAHTAINRRSNQSRFHPLVSLDGRPLSFQPV